MKNSYRDQVKKIGLSILVGTLSASVWAADARAESDQRQTAEDTRRLLYTHQRQLAEYIRTGDAIAIEQTRQFIANDKANLQNALQNHRNDHQDRNGRWEDNDRRYEQARRGRWQQNGPWDQRHRHDHARAFGR